MPKFLPVFRDFSFPAKNRSLLSKISSGNVEDGRNAMRNTGTDYRTKRAQIAFQQGCRNQDMRTVRAAFQIFGYKQALLSVSQNIVSADFAPRASGSDLSALKTDLRPMALYDHS